MDIALVATGALVLVYALVLRAIWIPRGVTDLGWGTLGLQAGLVGVSGAFCTWRGHWGLGLLLGLAFGLVVFLLSVKTQDLLRVKWRPSVAKVPPADETYDAPDVGQRDRFHAALAARPEGMTGPFDPVEAERVRSEGVARLFG